MTTFFMFGNYSRDAVKGIAAKRTAKAEELIKGFGGKLRSVHALLGEYDLVLIAELPGVQEAMHVSVEISKDSPPLSLCVFGKRQLFHVKLRPAGLHQLQMNYVEKRHQTEVRRESAVEALKITLEAEPLASDLDDVENFSFLGFRKEIAIYIDPVSNLPVQLSGVIPKAGNVTIKLLEAQLNKGN